MSLIRTATLALSQKTHDVRKHVTAWAPFLNEVTFPNLASHTGWSLMKALLKAVISLHLDLEPPPPMGSCYHALDMNLQCEIPRTKSIIVFTINKGSYSSELAPSIKPGVLPLITLADFFGMLLGCFSYRPCSQKTDFEFEN